MLFVPVRPLILKPVRTPQLCDILFLALEASFVAATYFRRVWKTWQLTGMHHPDYPQIFGRVAWHMVSHSMLEMQHTDDSIATHPARRKGPTGTVLAVGHTLSSVANTQSGTREHTYSQWTRYTVCPVNPSDITLVPGTALADTKRARRMKWTGWTQCTSSSWSPGNGSSVTHE